MSEGSPSDGERRSQSNERSEIKSIITNEKLHLLLLCFLTSMVWSAKLMPWFVSRILYSLRMRGMILNRPDMESQPRDHQKPLDKCQTIAECDKERKREKYRGGVSDVDVT